ncbi:hypothetical protein TrLO_g6713 [Triparma laevis f. longispina]|uniref:Thioesterase domain-containing protein n=1 Tax=Triparma laevis f. longispina TaxID=1714387 RepID=A0A9W7KXT1_9STRA|nr:hypothetical protein TrLO_g6713 [Triparma laevis f. longispina]
MFPTHRVLKTGSSLGHRLLILRTLVTNNGSDGMNVNRVAKPRNKEYSKATASNNTCQQRSASTDANGAKVGGLDVEDFKLLVERAAPWSELQGYRLEEARKGFLKVRLPFNKNWIGNVSIPAMHGGVVASLIDHVGGFCAWTVLNRPSDRVSTADLSISYLSPAPASDLIGEGRVYHESNKLVRVDIVVYCAGDEKQVSIAAGRGCFYRRGGGGAEKMAGLSAEEKQVKAAKEAKEQDMFFKHLRSKGKHEEDKEN